MVDKLIRETLRHKAEDVDVPAGVWAEIRRQVPVRPSLWQRLRLGRVLEVAAIAAAAVLMAGLGLLRGLGPDTGRPSGGAPSIGLTLEEYWLTTNEKADRDPLALRERVTPAMLEKRQPWRTPSPDELVKEANEALEPFGYRLVLQTYGAEQRYDLYQGETVTQAGMTWVRPVTLSARGDDFLLVGALGDEGWVLVQANRVRTWDPAEVMKHGFHPPVYAGDSIVSVRDGTVYRDERSAFGPGQPLYHLREGQVRRLSAWGDRWVLEGDGHVYVEGKWLNLELGYEEIFEWRLIKGKPFFFFRGKDGKMGVSYDGKILSLPYDWVPHDLCCEAAMLNIQGSDVMISFYARKGTDWYYVDLGIYE